MARLERAVALLLVTVAATCAVAQDKASAASTKAHHSVDARESTTARADPELLKARTFAEQQNWSEAETATRGYLVPHPKSATGHSLLGLILFQTDRAGEAITEYKEASKYHPLNASDSKTLALALATSGKFPESEKWMKRALSLDPGDLGSWQALGHLMIMMGRFEEAIPAFQNVLALAPNTVFAETEIALAYERIAKLTQAESAFRTAIQWEASVPTGDPVPMLGLGRVLIKQRKPQEALIPLQKAMEMAPNNSECHEQTGQAYSDLNRLNDAQREFERAIELSPNIARVHLALGQVYRKRGMLDKAKEEMGLYSALSASGFQKSNDAQPGAPNPH